MKKFLITLITIILFIGIFAFIASSCKEKEATYTFAVNIDNATNNIEILVKQNDQDFVNYSKVQKLHYGDVIKITTDPYLIVAVGTNTITGSDYLLINGVEAADGNLGNEYYFKVLNNVSIEFIKYKLPNRPVEY